ncbi:MAG: HlyD family efflux transporter periplasmic adaptor subunit [Prevotellaceae bacterium]|jgi:HlyD family secretion protein|nr:HlyD family efflux transporter periplasmic adaptor subunit [Prevotellaceae bacterium]
MKQIEIHTQEVNDILYRPPVWILRWGITVFFIIIIALFIGSIFFRYPDIITAQVSISSINLPVHLRAKTSGKIERFLVQDGDNVQTGSVTAMIESATDYNDFQALKQFCETFRKQSTQLSTPEGNIDPPLHINLGNIQSSYTQFLKSQQDYNAFITANYHNQKIALIRKQITQQQEILQQGARQLRNYEEQSLIHKSAYTRDSVLFTQGVIPQAEMEQSRVKRLTAEQQYESLKTTITNIKLTLLQSEQMIFELTQEYTDRRLLLENALTGNFDNLTSQMSQWEQTNLLISPITGNVVYTQYWQEHQNVNAGDLVLTIVPQEKAGISGKLYLPLQGAGKVKVGQQVNVKLDNFPYMEFGMVEAVIVHISMVPIEMNGVKMLIADMSFPNGLTTNYNITLESGEEMNGTGDIITEEISLFARFFNPIKYVFRSRT